MFVIVPIVEGHGETSAVPELLRRIVSAVAPGVAFEVRRAIRVRRNRLIKLGELERAVELAARQLRRHDLILVLVDADRDCPAELAPQLLARARQQRSDRQISVVMAKREFEAWFLAAARSIAGRRGLRPDLTPPDRPEEIADPKRWLTSHGSGAWAYSETLDQPAFAAVFDLASARVAPSFDKLWRDLEAALQRHRREDS